MSLVVGVMVGAFGVYVVATEWRWRDARTRAADQASLIGALKAANAEQATLIDLLLRDAATQPMAWTTATPRQMATRH